MLQPGNYFGLSAATGDAPDHHQLFGFTLTPLEATALDPPPVENQVKPVLKEETSVKPNSRHHSNTRTKSKLKLRHWQLEFKNGKTRIVLFFVV